MMLVLLDQDKVNNLIHSAMGLPTVPTLGSIIYPNEPTQQLIFNMAFEEEGQISKFLGAVLSWRYLVELLPGRHQDEYNLSELFRTRNEDFKQAVCITKDGFVWLLQQIYLNPIFYSKSHQSQLPIGHQLA
jgi:hypothetical protein